MRFERIKGFLLGVALCLVIGMLSIPAFAESVGKQITAYYNDIKLIINGETVIPKDAKGNVVDPFIVDGTTYLPVRAVAEALGQAVSWDGNTKSVIIGANEEYKQPTIWLDAMKPTNDGFKVVSEDTPIKDNLNASYKSYMYGGSTATYALNGQYKRFTGKFLVQQGKSVSGCQRLTVLVDDKVVYSSEPVEKGSLPIDFDIDVSGGLTMKIVLECDWHYDSFSHSSSHIHEKFIQASAYTQETAIANAGLWAD